MEKHKKLLESFQTEFEQLKEKHEKTFIETVVNPFCKKYGFEYVEGNGTYFFEATENYRGKKAWLKGHYDESDNGKYLNTESKDKTIKNFIETFDSLFNYITYFNWNEY